MTIVSQTGGVVANYDNIQEIYIGGDRTSIKADFISGRGCELGKYASTDQCIRALQTMAASIRDQERVFEFPKKIGN